MNCAIVLAMDKTNEAAGFLVCAARVCPIAPCNNITCATKEYCAVHKRALSRLVLLNLLIS